MQLVSLEGLPSDAASREEFTQAFRMTFAEDEFRIAVAAPGNGFTVGDPFTNRFRLLEGAASEDAWALQVVLGAPPVVVPARPKPKAGQPVKRRNAGTLGRATRGLTVVLLVQSPEAVKAGARPIPLRLGLTFPDTSATDHVGARVGGGGYDFPWEQAGHSAAILALEVLHQRALELHELDRLELGPAALRAEAGR